MRPDWSASLRTSINMTKLAKYTSELYRGLEAETGQATGYRQCGSISMATNTERFEELKRSASMAKVFDLEVNVIGVDEIVARYPLVNSSDLLGGIHIPSDGYANAVDISQALAKGARNHGAQIFQNTKVTAILNDGDKVTGVATDQWQHSRRLRRHLRRHVVTRSGCQCRRKRAAARLRALLRLVRVSRRPAPGACRYYVTTMPALTTNMMPASCWSVRLNRRQNPGAWMASPKTFASTRLPETSTISNPCLHDAMAAYSRPARRRYSEVLLWTGELHAGCSLSPRRSARARRTVLFPRGLNSIGLQSAGGIGKVMAGMDARRPSAGRSLGGRCPPQHARFRATASTCKRASAKAWDCCMRHIGHFVSTKPRAAFAKSAIHDRLVASRRMSWRGIRLGTAKLVCACKASSQNTNTVTADKTGSNTPRQNIVQYASGVALFDQSSFAKFRLEGRDAMRVLNQRLCQRHRCRCGSSGLHAMAE